MEDINSEIATVSYWSANDGDAMTILQAIKTLSNARVNKADTSFPVDITGLANNNANANDISTVKAKGKMHLTGYNPNSNGQRFDSVKISVPAPIGSQFVGPTGDVTNIHVQGLKSVVQSVRGVPMDNVKSYKLGR
jgi:hypothetical protein